MKEFKEEMRYDYPHLDEYSTVWDIGGYKGDFAYNINKKYGCVVQVFEPIEYYYVQLVSRFNNNPDIFINNFALSSDNGTAYMTVHDDRSSLHMGSRDIPVVTRDIAEFMKDENGGEDIDLMKINIEGEEFNLLTHMIDNKMMYMVNHLQVQFHKFMHEADTRRSIIQDKLVRTHKLNWNYDFIWESWERI